VFTIITFPFLVSVVTYSTPRLWLTDFLARSSV
jgi:hypothetical protein